MRELDHQFSVLHLSFWPYAHLFAKWSQRPGCVYESDAGWPDSLARFVSHLPGGRTWRFHWGVQQLSRMLSHTMRPFGADVLDDRLRRPVDLQDPSFIERARAGRPFVCSGWQYSCWPWLERHAAAVRSQFAPALHLRTATETFIRDLRCRYDILLGLYIRRGDYRNYRAGRFYFEWDDYVRWARQARDLYPGKRVGFLLAGDDPIPVESFPGLPVELATGSANRGGHWIESFLELSQCDMVISAPSTFSACAAFLRNVAWWPLLENSQELNLNQPLAGSLIDAWRDPTLRDVIK